jgi:hypothetical protein
MRGSDFPLDKLKRKQEKVYPNKNESIAGNPRPAMQRMHNSFGEASIYSSGVG